MSTQIAGSRKLDGAALLKRFDGDAELLRDIADTFLSHCPDQLTAVERAATAGDAARLRDAAHSIRGAVANFGAEDAVAAAFRLERMAVDGALDDLHAAWGELRATVGRLRAELKELVTET